jgi:hypothetical protein
VIVVCKTVIGLPNAPVVGERVTEAVLFDVAPRAITLSVDEVPLEGVPALLVAEIDTLNDWSDAEVPKLATPPEVMVT